jgi:TRAP-type uncharacterized transport system fused permease subunit
MAVVVGVTLGWSGDRVGLTGYLAAAGVVEVAHAVEPRGRRFDPGLEDGAKNTLAVAAACAGIAIGVVALTGSGSGSPRSSGRSSSGMGRGSC